MKPSFSLIFTTLICCLIFGCTDSNPLESAPSGAYLYASSDTTGVLLVQGWMTLDIQDSTQVTGEWHFGKVGNPEDIGPQVGSGELLGSFYQGELSVELNPNMADNNILLVGILTNNRYHGDWTWSTIIGPTSSGVFEAVKN